MARKEDFYRKALKILESLQKDYPQLSLGMHISTAFSDYGGLDAIWGLTHKEFYFALEKYQMQLSIDEYSHLPSQREIDRIVEDANKLFPNDPWEEEEE